MDRRDLVKRLGFSSAVIPSVNGKEIVKVEGPSPRAVDKGREARPIQ
jgi:hypothetical protein